MAGAYLVAKAWRAMVLHGERFPRAARGERLHAEHSGPDGGAAGRMVLLHGFAQTCRCWGALGEGLARDHEVVRLDAPGHGRSSEVRADLPATGDLAARTAGRGTWVGYSMGARMALHVALQHPGVVARLVLISGTAGIDDGEERADRRRRDLVSAARIRAEGVEAFLAGWFDQPMFASLPAGARFLNERRRNTAEGLAGSLELAGTGAMAPLWADLPALEMPVLLVAGEADERYLALARRMAGAIGGNAAVAVVPEAGHAVHLEQPAAVLAVLRDWLVANPEPSA